MYKFCFFPLSRSLFPLISLHRALLPPRLVSRPPPPLFFVLLSLYPPSRSSTCLIHTITLAATLITCTLHYIADEAGMIVVVEIPVSHAILGFC